MTPPSLIAKRVDFFSRGHEAGRDAAFSSCEGWRSGTRTGT